VYAHQKSCTQAIINSQHDINRLTLGLKWLGLYPFAPVFCQSVKPVNALAHRTAGLFLSRYFPDTCDLVQGELVGGFVDSMLSLGPEQSSTIEYHLHAAHGVNL